MNTEWKDVTNRKATFRRPVIARGALQNLSYSNNLTNSPGLPKKSRQKTIEENRSRHSDTIIGLHVLIDGINIHALHDTGAEMNFLNNYYAQEIGLQPTYFLPEQYVSLRIGNGRIINSIGKVEAEWQFNEEPENKYKITFQVLPDCIFDVMIGAIFLYATSILTTNRLRLTRIPKPARALKTRVVNLCGLPGRELNGFLENERCSALPDSGAEPNLLSYEFAKQKGWLLATFAAPESDFLLQFADGSTETIEGRLRLIWSFKRGWTVAEDQIPFNTVVVFDVLRDCPFHIVLGQDFLDETEAFTQHMRAFEDVHGDHIAGLNLIVRARGNLKEKVKQKLYKTRQQPSEPLAGAIDPSTTLVDELDMRARMEGKIRRNGGSSAQATAWQKRRLDAPNGKQIIRVFSS